MAPILVSTLEFYEFCTGCHSFFKRAGNLLRKSPRLSHPTRQSYRFCPLGRSFVSVITSQTSWPSLAKRVPSRFSPRGSPACVFRARPKGQIATTRTLSCLGQAGSTQVSNSLTLIRTCYLDSTVFALGEANTCLRLSSPHVKRAGALLPKHQVQK